MLVNRYRLYFIRKKRYCIDCKNCISDKRLAIHSQGRRCKDCQQNYRDQYLHDYWQRFKAKYLQRRKDKAGGTRDKFTIETIERSLPKGQYQSLKMVKIVRKRFDAPDMVDFEYEVSDAKLQELKRKYGDSNIFVL